MVTVRYKLWNILIELVSIPLYWKIRPTARKYPFMVNYLIFFSSLKYSSQHITLHKIIVSFYSLKHFNVLSVRKVAKKEWKATQLRIWIENSAYDMETAPMRRKVSILHFENLEKWKRNPLLFPNWLFEQIHIFNYLRPWLIAPLFLTIKRRRKNLGQVFSVFIFL